MPASMAELLTEISRQASDFERPILAHLCRVAALEAERDPIPAQEQKIVGLYDWDVSNDRTLGDSGMACLFGLPKLVTRKGAPIGDYLKAVHPDDIDPLIAAIATAMSRGGEFRAQYRLIANDRVRHVYAHGFCTLDISGRPERFPGAIIERRCIAN